MPGCAGDVDYRERHLEFLLERRGDLAGELIRAAAGTPRHDEFDGTGRILLLRESGADHWQYWSITDDETALLVSYQCAREHAGEEAAAVEEIVRSVRLYGSAPKN